jgi:UDP-glucose 4-epimerase
LGSNLAIRLVNLGATVSIVDAMVDGCGGNVYNIASVADRVRVVRANIGAPRRLRRLIRGASVIFNLAGEISHIHSMRWPRRDALLNGASQLNFLEECARSAPGVRIVYAGTRQVYGVPKYLPVDEDHPINPVDFNGIHKGSALMYHLLYARTKKLDAVVLNLSNLYGPRMALSAPCQGFLANFIRKLMTGRRLEVFGDGRQLRDPVYIDEAVDAFLMAGSIERPPSPVYNVGGPEPLSLSRIAEIASRAAGQDPPTRRPFPPELEIIDIGSYYADTSRIRRELGWKPGIAFEEGIGRTLSFYRAELPHYLESFDSEPVCALHLPDPQPALAVCP